MQWLSKCSDHQKCTKGILKHRGHSWGPGTLFLKSAMTRPIGDITQWWPSGSLPHKSPSREALLRPQERLHIDTIPINSQVGEAQWHPSRSCPGGMEECPWTIRYSNGFLHEKWQWHPSRFHEPGETMLQKSHLAKSMIVSPGGNASHCRMPPFSALLGLYKNPS